MTNLQQKVNEEKTKLEVYDDLPPNISLVKSKIEQIENEIVIS